MTPRPVHRGFLAGSLLGVGRVAQAPSISSDVGRTQAQFVMPPRNIECGNVRAWPTTTGHLNHQELDTGDLRISFLPRPVLTHTHHFSVRDATIVTPTQPQSLVTLNNLDKMVVQQHILNWLYSVLTSVCHAHGMSTTISFLSRSQPIN